MKCFAQSIYTLVFFLGVPLMALANGDHVSVEEHSDTATIDPLVLGGAVGAVVVGATLLWFFVLKKK